MPTKYKAIKVYKRGKSVAEIICGRYEPNIDSACKHSGNCKNEVLRTLGEFSELRCFAKELKFPYTSEHECLKCGKKVVVENSTSVPTGWLLRNDGVTLCDKCKDEQDDLVEFLKEIYEAKLALEFAINVLDKTNILIGRRKEIRGQLQALVAKLKQMIVDCRVSKPTEEELKAEIEKIKAIVQMG
ncbi:MULTISPECIES: hypothetical protein [unclassified Archaeoglobus]|jgi:NAD-dependent SIR2 family protein deacetylase|uniref:hypothetical protein n=1 Tax=unclassified Archaeoglobus TaxID=2643606 RepID=UPI0025C405A2|nr:MULTISPECIES: hypothetical protein [unclassified Archaeoglobus]